MNKFNKKQKTAFFGTPDISVYFLDKLKKLGFDFDTFITNPDAEVGRKKILTQSKVSKWVNENYLIENNNTEKIEEKNIEIDTKNFKKKIKIFKPKKINSNFIENLKKEKYDFFFVLAYGKILPQEILEIPKLGTINLHPSLLPEYRGPSPIISAILDDKKNTGFSLILLDSKMDHGPIIFQEKIKIIEWEKNNKMEKFFAKKGAENFFKILKDFSENKIISKSQNDNNATFCRKYNKEDMEINFPITEKNSRKNFLKYCAFQKPFFIFDKKNKKGDSIKNRAIITEASFENNFFKIKKVIPEGKKEQDFLEKNFI